jgi:hypothetical protein
MKLTRAPKELTIPGFHNQAAEVKTFDNTYPLESQSYKRDAIIKIIRQHNTDAIPIIAHLKKFGKKSLDEYSQVEIIILPPCMPRKHRLVFTTTRMEVSEMTYTVSDLSLDPDPRLAAKWPWY